MTRSPSEIEADLRALNELAASRGWALVCEHLKSEVYKLSVARSRNVDLNKRQAGMADGAISATDGFTKLVDIMLARLAGEKALDATPPGAPDNAEP